jgi:pimeloyl-ACP methyl ester carboxylesterase
VSGLLKWATKAVGEAALLVLGATLPKQDRTAMLQHPRVFAALIPTLLSDAFKQGGRGFFADMRLTTLPWDFSLGRIAVPTVVFQGDADVTVTVKMADWLGRHIPGAEVKLYRNEAHFSLIVNHTAEMLKMVLQKAA